MARTDGEVLGALYIATGGAAWNNNRNWNTTAALSQWYGVEVDTQDRVVKLSLGSNNLRGPIPAELGNLAALEELNLRENELSGHIPAQLGDLRALKILVLSNNKLEGPIPPELGALRELKALWLSHNQLTGPIPKELGALNKLGSLWLEQNGLTGHIPPELGNLNALVLLHLYENQLSGPIPPELGGLTALQRLRLYENQLSGHIPPELGNLSALCVLYLNNNQLSGSIPAEFGKLAALKRLDLRSNQVTGGQKKNESLSAWRSRLKSELVELERAEQVRVQQSRAEEHATLQLGGTKAAPAGRVSSSGGRDSQRLFRAQVASFAELDELTRKNEQSLEEMRSLMANPATGSSPSAIELTDADKLKELDRLLAMAKTLGEMTSIYVDDKNMQGKERSLSPGPEAYYTAVRSGLCNAYLAASVVDSGVVSTSKVGAMGKAGTTLKLISGAVPLVGGLAGFAGAALKAGDCFVQTRQVVKITELAVDAVECSILAKSLALRLTGGLPDGTIPMTQDAKEHRTAAGVGWGSGDSTPHEGFGLAEGVDEEAVMEWFVEEVANCDLSNCGGTTPIQEVQAGRRLGKRHLHELLTAVARGCLEGVKTPEEKASRLFLVVLSETDSRSTEASNTSEGVVVRSPESGPSHDGGIQQLAAEVEALKAAMKSDKEKHHAEVHALKGTITTLEKHLPKSHGGLAGSVDAGGGYIFAQEQKTETQEEFNERMENPARAADRQTATTDELRVTQAHVEEVSRETGNLGARVAALEENRGKKKGFPFRWRGKR